MSAYLSVNPSNKFNGLYVHIKNKHLHYISHYFLISLSSASDDNTWLFNSRHESVLRRRLVLFL